MLLGSGLLAQAAAAETLADAISAAYDRNPVLVEQRYLQKARDENYVQARSEYGPTLSVQSNGGYSSRRALGRTVNGNSGEVEATISQPIYTAGRLRGAVESARAGVLGGQQQVRQVEQQTIQNVVQVYAAVLRDEARLQVGLEALDVLRGQLEQNSKRQEKGDVTLTDVAQSRSRVESAEQQVDVLDANMATSRSQYLQVVGHNPGTLEPLPQLPTLPSTIDQAFAKADEASPQILIARFTEQSSSANAASVRGERGPTVSLTGQGIYSNRLFQFDGRSGSKEVFGGFTLSQPLLTGGAIQSRIRQADARNLADQAGVDAARRGALQDVAQAWNDMAAARGAIAAGQRQVEAAQQAFAGMSCEELNGLRTTIETLNAQRELQGAQETLLQYRYQYYVSHAALLAAMGVLSAQDIVTNIAVYDPEANFRRVRNRGLMPLDYLGMALDRIGSASPRRPLSGDLTGINVPASNATAAMPDQPSDAMLHDKLTSRGDRTLRLPNGAVARCPLGTLRAR
ncbi:TolC family outer membrane protein [uncultured Sphingomonas sp.]|uniref:TolC family outer membrane protein n=1 Tax=uncultured Sphingomonas sp. TaxID=158754 RepID=UPI0025EE73F1|nr:TolC family outer membrane protein [uncultured Sphingomonas sp.]